MDKFRKALFDCGLKALQTNGSKFTWSKGKNSNLILERLDKDLATDIWFELFPYSYEMHLVALVFDNVPLVFHISDQQ